MGGRFEMTISLGQGRQCSLPPPPHNLPPHSRAFGLVDVFGGPEVVTHRDGVAYDHLFITSNISVEDTEVVNAKNRDNVEVSDHFGIQARLRLPGTASP